MTKATGGGTTLTLDLSAAQPSTAPTKAERRASVVEELLRQLSAKGLTLEQCTGRRVMNRKLRTLQRYCRRFYIAFPDYVPAAMRKKSGSE